MITEQQTALVLCVSRTDIVALSHAYDLEHKLSLGDIYEAAKAALRVLDEQFAEEFQFQIEQLLEEGQHD